MNWVVLFIGTLSLALPVAYVMMRLLDLDAAQRAEHAKIQEAKHTLRLIEHSLEHVRRTTTTLSNGKTYRWNGQRNGLVPVDVHAEAERLIEAKANAKWSASTPAAARALKAVGVDAEPVKQEPPAPEGIEPEAWKAALEEVEKVAENPADYLVLEIPGPRDPVKRKRRDLPPLDDKVRALVEKQRAQR